MRQYENYWGQLKENNSIVLDCPRDKHKRVTKAIRKESYLDVAFRLQLAETKKRVTIYSSSFRNRLTLSIEVKDDS